MRHTAQRASGQPVTNVAILAQGIPRRHFLPWSGAEEVVVDVFLPFVAKERDDVPQGRVPRSQLAGSEKVRARTGTHEQPELAGQAAHLGDRRVAVHRDYLIDDVLVPGEDARDEAVGNAFNKVPTNLATHQGARLIGLDGNDPAGSVALTTVENLSQFLEIYC
jgi:hypothetical protein